MNDTEGRSDRFKIGIVVITLIWTSALVLIIYLVFWHENPAVEFNSTELLTPVVEQEGVIVFDLDWCAFTRAPRTVRKTWRDGLVYTEPLAAPHAAPVGCQVSRIQWDVPHGLPPGEYIIGAEVVVDVNLLANRVARFEVGPIDVTEKE